MKKLVLLSLLALFFGTSASKAQIGFAVAKDENNSAIAWRVNWGLDSYYACERASKQDLRDSGYDNIYGQSDGTSGPVEDGYYVVIEGIHKFSGGKRTRGYGFGASSNSWSEAEKRAVKSLSTNFWSWTRSDGYEISKKGTF